MGGLYATSSSLSKPLLAFLVLNDVGFSSWWNLEAHGLGVPWLNDLVTVRVVSGPVFLDAALPAAGASRGVSPEKRLSLLPEKVAAIVAVHRQGNLAASVPSDLTDTVSVVVPDPLCYLFFAYLCHLIYPLQFEGVINLTTGGDFLILVPIVMGQVDSLSNRL